MSRPGPMVGVGAIVGALWLALLSQGQPHTVQAVPDAIPTAVAALLPTAEPAAPAAPAGAFATTPGGPTGCPVVPAAGAVVMTQGYGVGTHAPAKIWGAIDLAVDGDGDGAADIDPSWYVPIVATHAGTVTATPNSWPAGNHVWVDDGAGVRTGYAHLAEILVTSGQRVEAGTPIGLLGSTGMSSGPHLDYQVWLHGVNVDPTLLVGC